MPQWRLTLDVPHTFCVQPGFQRAVHHSDFRPEKDSHNHTYRCPVTGLVMLSPSLERRDFASDFKRLSNWRYTPQHWQESLRGIEGSTPNMMTSVKPASRGFSLIELLVDVATLAIGADLAFGDDLKWVLESKFTLASDEGFSLHYHGLGDEIRRKENWFCVQWDNIGLHFSCNGLVRVYEYDRTNLNTAAKLLDQFEIASSGELLNKTGYFNFIPIPNFGLVVTHTRTAQKGFFAPSNVDAGTPRGHLIPWKTRTLDTGLRLFESSLVRIGYNPYIPCNLGFMTIAYPASGDYTDAITDPGFKPSVDPAEVLSRTVDTGYGSVATTFVKTDKSGAWAAGTDRQGRVKIALTADASKKHTPFVYVYGITFAAQFATRNTTPLELSRFQSIDGLKALEWTQDIDANFEGKATMMLATPAAIAIAARGDSTFRLDWRKDNADAWKILTGGLAKQWETTEMYDVNYGTWYEVTCVLKGMEERFRECHALVESAFDGLDLGTAFAVFLNGCSVPGLAFVPPEAAAVSIPPPQGDKQWKFAPKEGDKGDHIRDTLLLFMKKQYEEWRLRYDWSLNQHILERKPRLDGASTWELRPDGYYNEAAKFWLYDNPSKYTPEPPEGNLIIVEGLTDATPKGKRIQGVTGSAGNIPSINDPTSPDYLGRVLTTKVTMHGVTDQNTLRLMARRVKEAISHRRVKHTVGCERVAMSLVPGTFIRKYDAEGRFTYGGWLKERTIMVTTEDLETMILHLDTIWEGDLV